VSTRGTEPGGGRRSPPPRGPDRARGLYARFLALYPRRFRDRFRADLLQAFDDRRAEARYSGVVGGARLVLLLLRDFVTSVPLAYSTQPRQRGVDGIVNDLMRDLRFSVRMLVKNPMFTVAAVATLALGIGLNAATFSAVRGILLAPLPGTDHPERLVQLYRDWPGIEYGSNSIPHYQDVRDRSSEVFENVAAWNFSPMSLSADGRSERLIGMIVSANFFQTYGVTPARGRAFIPGEEDVGPGAHPVAVLGHSFWRSRFGADPAVVGSTMILNGHPFEIVGVAPPEFKGPFSIADVPVYVPIMMIPQIMPGSNLLEQRGSNSFTAVGRLRDGVTVERAREAMDVILAQLREEYPDSYRRQLGTTMVLQSEAGIHPSFGSAQVGMGTVMMAVVGLLLLIACVNVANLFLARARDRRREMGIRLSIGAGRGRIIQQLLTESLVFSVVAGLAGLGLARVASGLLSNIRPPIDGPWSIDASIDGTVLWFAVIVSIAAGVLFGLAPALQAANPDTVSAVKGESNAASGRSRMSSALIVAQMALSLLLLISSGLFLRSLQGATRIDPGFDDPANLVMASLDPGLQGYDEARTSAFFDRLTEEISALPEVTSVALANQVPLSLGSSDSGVDIPGYEFAENEPRNIFYSMVREGYFETMGIDVAEGRTFTRADDETGPPVIIVNQRFADRFWPNQSALGKIVHAGSKDREVIGVVETGKYNSLGEKPAEFMYFPHRERFRSAMTVIARTPSDPQAVLRQIRSAVAADDPNLPLYDVRTMEDHMGIALLPARLGGSVLGLFGLLGLALAAVGIYGVMAYSVSQRKRELGIRIALGADRRAVLALVLGEGLRLALIGTAIGLAGAFGAARLVEGLLYNVSALDPVAFVGVPAVLVAVAGLAVYLPARTAASVEPMRVLKTE
jgi:putative ABC transport system permease protein